MAILLFTESDTIRAWSKILLNGEMKTAEAVEITMIAGEEIIATDSAWISPDIHLLIQKADICGDKVYPVSWEEVKQFCKSEKYKAKELATKSQASYTESFTEIELLDLKYQVYPNPVTNNTVNFDLELPEAKVLQFEVYDLYGKKLKTLFSGEKSAGYSSESYDISDLSAGVYLYKIIGDNIMESGKLMKVK